MVAELRYAAPRRLCVDAGRTGIQPSMNAPIRSIEGKPIPVLARRRRRRLLGRLPYLVLLLMVLTLVGVVLFPHVTVTVPSGEVGVLWRRFGGGTVLDPKQLRDEGLHFILPWNKLFLYDLRLQSITEDYNAISSDGVSMTASINIRFRLQRDGTPVVHQTLGPNYVDVLIRPGIGSLTREVISQYTSEEVYSTARQEIQRKIHQLTLEKAAQRTMQRTAEVEDESYTVQLKSLFILYDTLLYGLELPAAVVAAINRKVEQYYIVQEYGFRVEREKKESERKRIEAQGIKEFQQIVSQGITPSYLQWRGIEATLQLSQSTNSKIVVIGSGKDGLPVILGGSGSADGDGKKGGAAALPSDGATQSEARADTPWPSLSTADIAEYLAHTTEMDWPDAAEKPAR
jgi:regulator of protease activity HflC (stomatin/prohibitin superfamily)